LPELKTPFAQRRPAVPRSAGTSKATLTRASRCATKARSAITLAGESAKGELFRQAFGGSILHSAFVIRHSVGLAVGILPMEDFYIDGVPPLG
jgi:hypothetical protein